MSENIFPWDSALEMIAPYLVGVGIGVVLTALIIMVRQAYLDASRRNDEDVP